MDNSRCSMSFKRAPSQGSAQSTVNSSKSVVHVSSLIIPVIVISSLPMWKNQEPKAISELFKVKWQISHRSKTRAYILRLQNQWGSRAETSYTVLFNNRHCIMITEYPRKKKICFCLSFNSMNIYWEHIVGQAFFGSLLLHNKQPPNVLA